MPEPIHVVLDTNVLYAGLRSRRGASYRILDAVARRRIGPVLSTTLVFEYEEALRRDRTALHLSERQIDGLLDELCLTGDCRRGCFLWRPVLSDPKDDHILELAIASGGVTVLTHNVRHFGEASQFGVLVRTPGEFLEGWR